ncbi:hypothetical protein AK812_SmicGene32374 [Symbiodinium microadriaticum]|uniref:Uncharacterized protein n=1 Tax=Symbiodinium microadriaticum TaxID=2951 RepID=A0A1Q9CUA8_SYMMI|nr:hypothetical protein AK812_SmicGene32374 [Symbiodinium microadriaticum]
MTYNLVAKILRKRLEAAIDAKLHTSQFGFRTSRSTAQAIHVARCLTESAERHGSTLYMQLLGWTQDFDKLHSQAVTQALTRHGVMPDFVDLVEAIVPAVAASRQNQPFFDLAYADDTAIFTGTAERGQQVLHTLREVAAHSNLSLNYKKSVLLRSSNVQSLPVPHRLEAVTPQDPTDQGKGFVFFGLRFQGWELAIGNVYLESGNGPGARANPAILAVLIMALQELQQPWMVAGDWNCSPQDLQSSTTFMRAVRGRVIAPSEATTCQGSDIDSAVTRVELQAYVSVEVEWDVPFKPHGALRYRVQRRALHCLCCRFQICQFGQDPMTPPDQPVERQPCGKVEALYEVVHAKNSLAEIKQIELEAGMPGQGSCYGQWDEALKPSQCKLFQKELIKLADMLPPETDIDVTVLKAQLQGYMDEGEQQSSMVQYVLDRAKQEAKKWRDNKQASYEDEQVGKVLVAMSKKAMGPDGSSAQMWRPLQPDQAFNCSLVSGLAPLLPLEKTFIVTVPVTRCSPAVGFASIKGLPPLVRTAWLVPIGPEDG